MFLWFNPLNFLCRFRFREFCSFRRCRCRCEREDECEQREEVRCRCFEETCED